jgi:hypothetical protein
MPSGRSLAACSLVIAAASCATGATFRSGAGDRILEHPPFYAGNPAPADTAAIGHLPVAYQRGATQPPMFDPPGGPGTRER